MSSTRKAFDNFYAVLRNTQTLLESYKSEAVSRADKIKEILTTADAELTKAAEVKENAGGLRRQMGEALQALKSSVGASQKKLEEKSRIRNKLESVDAQARAKVIVFGRTNAGKSTLGNFLRGQSLRDAPFDNPWKNDSVKLEPIRVIETAGGKENEKSALWFKEGSTETTREIQCFTLPGLLWVDTPGIGSINDEELGALARKYADNADLVIYLDHSDNPGLTSHSEALVRLLGMGKETLALINQSDTMEYVKDADGKIRFEKNASGRLVPKQAPVPKTEEARRNQENQIIKSLREKGFKTDVALNAMSLSMLLANLAVKNEDDKLFEGSGLGKFLEKLAGVFSTRERIAQIMSGHVHSACLDLCDMALDGPGEDIPGLKQQIASQDIFLDKIKDLEEKFDVEAETAVIASWVGLDAKAYAQKILDDALTRPAKAARSLGACREKGSDGNAVPLDVGLLADKIQTRCNQLVSERITAAVKELFGGVEFKTILLDSSRLKGFKLERQTETHTYEIPEAYTYRREPSGFWENLRSLFGKEYHGVGRRMTRKIQTIDLGYNREDVQARLNAVLNEMIPDTVRKALAEAKEETLGYARAKVEQSLAILKKTRAQILDVKERVQNSMTGADG